MFDTFGQPIVTWSTLGVYWGEVEPLRGNELVSAKQVKAQATVKIRTRWLGSGIVFGPENRWVLGDRLVPTATVTNGSAAVTLSAAAPNIAVNSWVVLPQDTSLTVYKVTANSGTAMVVSPVYGGATQVEAPISQARFFGLFDTTNIEERNRAYTALAYEIQQGGPI